MLTLTPTFARSTVSKIKFSELVIKPAFVAIEANNGDVVLYWEMECNSAIGQLFNELAGEFEFWMIVVGERERFGFLLLLDDDIFKFEHIPSDQNDSQLQTVRGAS